jgi:hypothetical protein
VHGNCVCHRYPHDLDLNPCPACRRRFVDVEDARIGSVLDARDVAEGWHYPPDDGIGWSEYRIGA